MRGIRAELKSGASYATASHKLHLCTTGACGHEACIIIITINPTGCGVGHRAFSVTRFQEAGTGYYW